MEPVFIQKYGKHICKPEDIRTNKTVLKPYRVTRHRTDAYNEKANCNPVDVIKKGGDWNVKGKISEFGTIISGAGGAFDHNTAIS